MATQTVQDKIEQLEKDFKFFKSEVNIDQIKKEIKDLWDCAGKQIDSINNLVSQKDFDWGNLDKLREVLQDVNSLEDNFKALKDEFSSFQLDLRHIGEQQNDIKKNQEDWTILHVKLQSSLTNIKEDLEDGKAASKYRDEKQEKESKQRKKDKRSLALWGIGILFTIVFSSLNLGLSRMDKREGERQKIFDIRDSLQNVKIDQIKAQNDTMLKDMRQIIEGMKE